MFRKKFIKQKIKRMIIITAKDVTLQVDLLASLTISRYVEL